MLLTREEMTYDFGGARLDPVRDRDLLQFVFSQYLYGEITGIQVGHWLYSAPDLAAARFLAKQAVEEMQHVGNFLRIFELLDLSPEPPHPLVRFLATGMMGGDWPQHVATEMALGEGFVLTTMYAVLDTLDQREIQTILSRAVRQEESHVAFGETRTQELVQSDPSLRQPLLGFALLWLRGVERFGAFIARKVDSTHPVLGRMPEFTAHTLRCAELRIQRMGLSAMPPLTLPMTTQLGLIAQAYGSSLRNGIRSAIGRSFSPMTFLLSLAGLSRRGGRLTDRYLDDPSISALFSQLPAQPAGGRQRAR